MHHSHSGPAGRGIGDGASDGGFRGDKLNTDLSVYIVPWVFISRIDYKLMFAAIACCGLRLSGVPPSETWWPRSTKFGLGGVPLR